MNKKGLKTSLLVGFGIVTAATGLAVMIASILNFIIAHKMGLHYFAVFAFIVLGLAVSAIEYNGDAENHVKPKRMKRKAK